MNNKELNSTKILDVQSMKFGSEDDAGYDMYLPKITTNFTKALINHPSNKHLNVYIMTIILDGSKRELEFEDLAIFPDIALDRLLITNKTGEIIFHYENNIIQISDLISIPTGLQLLLPKNVWGEMCNRSSNFGKNLNVVIGYVDNTYTYGTAFQVHPINFKNTIVLEPETRIAQLILRPQIKPLYVHNSFESFENDHLTINNREKRSGGFGSTGTK